MSLKHGSIARLKFRNFLTYGSAEVVPGPRLNVVIGPNGSGKSSILCGLCLGLGGTPSLLGRADDVREFIMNEKNEGYVEVEVVNSKGKNDIIRRTLRRDADGKKGSGPIAGVFELNGSTASIKAVRELVESKYKIQVNNLLSFLPQDRVGHFSQYTPQQLLVETSKALNYRQLFEVQDKLIKMESELKTTANFTASTASRLSELKQATEKLNRDKKLVEDRRLAVSNVALLNKKKLWLDFDFERNKGIELKGKRDEAKKIMESAKSNLPALQAAETDAGGFIGRMESKKKAIMTAMEKQKNLFEKHRDKAEKFSNDFESTVEELKTLDEDIAKKEKSAEKQAKKVSSLEKKIVDAPDVTDAVKEIEELRPQLKVLSEKQHTIKKEKQKAEITFSNINTNLTAAKRKVQKMGEGHKIALEKVFGKKGELRRACEWVNKNRQRFRRSVYGPLAAEVQCKNETIAIYLDQHCNNNVLQCFVVETKEDADLLWKEVREKMGVRINIETMNPDTALDPQRDFGPQRFEKLKQNYGVLGYLDEMISGPDQVIKVLMNSSKIHQVVVGSVATGRAIDQDKNLVTSLSVRDNELNPNNSSRGLQSACVMTPFDNGEHYRYTSNISRHTNQANMGVSEIKNNSYQKIFCSTGVSEQEKQSANANYEKYKSEYKDMEAEFQSIEQELKDVATKAKEVNNKIAAAKKVSQDLASLKKELSIATKKLEELRAAAARDSDTEKKKIISLAETLAANISTHAEASAIAHGAFMDETFRAAGVECDLSDIRVEITRIKELLEEEETKTETVRADYDAAKNAFNECKSRIRDFKGRAETEAPFVDEDGAETPLKAQLDELPESLDEVALLIEEMDLKISEITDDPHVLQQYEEKQKEIRRLTDELEGESEQSSVKLAEIKSIAMPWIAKLENYVKVCDSRFSTYMSEIDCSGGVELKRCDTELGSPGNFADWGVLLKVKYRDATQLSVLNAQVHSGGERSVATIMYLMALQDQLSTPFRCVDEINQGMDEIFERKVFSRVVTNSCGEPDRSTGEHTGQYFLITPKLLPNLNDMENENVTVLCIFNGPFAFNKPSDWDVDKYVTRKRRLSLSQAQAHNDDDEDDDDDDQELRMKKKKQ